MKQECMSIAADRRLDINVDIYHIQENVMERKIRQLKDQHLAHLVGLELYEEGE